MPNHTIIISDLHIDDWTNRPIRGKPRARHFFDFLDWLDANEVAELIINGDVMDMPPYKGQYVFQPAPKADGPPDGEPSFVSRQVAERLLQYGAKRKITYVFGNHDIGISGFRCEGCNNVPGLQNANFAYPNYVTKIGNSAFLVEHGHFYDPFLALYLRDLAQRTYTPWTLDDFDWTMQRRDPDTGERATPGVPHEDLRPIRMKVGDNAYKTVVKAQEADQADMLAGIRSWSKKFADDIATAVVDVPKKAIWWAAALHKMERYIKEKKLSSGKLCQVFGHTHRVFVGEKKPGVGVMQKGVECFYFNSGGWTEDTDEGWYLDIDESGKVWIQDWIKEKKAFKEQK